MNHKLFGFIPRRTIDDPNQAEMRISSDAFLSHIYTHQIKIIHDYCEDSSARGLIVEIGAAGGVTKKTWPEVITTDVRAAKGVDRVMAAESLEFEDETLKCIFGMDAIHHVRNPFKHLAEVQRCLAPGGVAIYIEPNWNFFSKFAFGWALKYLHPEPYDMNQIDWQLSGDDPMMGNQAQGYNIFFRDQHKFRSSFPNLDISICEPIKGLSFLLSGGVHTRLPMPSNLLIKLFDWEESKTSWINTFGLGRVIKVTRI